MKNILNFVCEFISEAMSTKKLLIILILIPSIIFSQDINIQSLKSMSDVDLKTYLAEAQKKGYSLDQIKIIAKAQGVSDLEISELERRIMGLEASSTNNEFTSKNLV